MRIFERRVLRLEQAILDRIPAEPWAVFITTHLHGTPEAAADELTFRAAHSGMPVLTVRTVDGSRKAEAA